MALDSLEQRFKITLPPGYYFDFGPVRTPGAGGETYWFNDKDHGKVRISELAFSESVYNAYDVAAVMVHEAVHA